MKLANRLERSLGRFAVPHITLYIIFLQSLAFVLWMAADARNPGHGDEFLQRLLLIGGEVYHGEVWRIFSFVVIPPLTNPIFFFFGMYLLYLFGTALENHWGTFRYNLYLLVGWLASVAVAMALPALPATNAYLMGSIFLAFAFLYPDFQLLLFFIFPVKVKWIALVTWIGMFYQFCTGNWLVKLLVLAAIANFLLFFHRDLWQCAREAIAEWSTRPKPSAQPTNPSIAARRAASPKKPTREWNSDIAASVPARSVTASITSMCIRMFTNDEASHESGRTGDP